MHYFLGFFAGQPGLGRGCLVFDAFGQSWSVLVRYRRRVDRVGHPFLPGATEVVDQHVAGKGRKPGVKRSPIRFIAAHRAIQPDKYLLRKIFGVARRASKPITNVIDPPVLLFDEILPRACIASDASSDQSIGERAFFQPA